MPVTTFVPVRRTTAQRPLSQQPGAARHIAGHSSGWHPEDAPSSTINTSARYHTTEADELEEDDAYYETRISTSTRRYQQPEFSTPQRPRAVVVHRRTRTPHATRRPQPEPEPEAVPTRSRSRRRWHWLTYMGLGMLLMWLLWAALSWTVQWWQLKQDDWTYGRPRTFQTDVVVGHNDSPTNPSHFIAINLNRHIEIVEMPGGDATKARLYNGPVLLGPGQDLAPITLTFADVNGDSKPDMIVHVQGEQLVFINNGTEFRPLTPGEQVTLP